MTAPTREEGFTLVELLVSLAITGAAAGLLSASLWSAHAGGGRAAAAAAAGESVASAQAVLRDRIGHLVSDAADTTSADSDAPAAASLDTIGDARGFSFVAPPPDAGSPGAPLRYFVQRDAAGHLDLAALDARTPAAAMRARWRVEPLLDNVRDIDFAYYGSPTADLPPRWWSAWPGNAAPPALVRVRLHFARGDTRTWPDLLVRPGATVSATCRVTPTQGLCGAS